MNRGTALLLALAALLAHTLAIHVDAERDFAAPYDSAHVAYRIARNLVHQGHLVWNLSPVDGALGSYPAPLWVAVAAVAERLYLPVTLVCQNVGILATLLTLGLAAYFATDRFAGWIPPLLLLASGSVAASAANGTESALVMFLFTAAFVGFELRWRRRFTMALALLVAVRPEGVLLAGVFLAFAVLEHVRKSHQGRKMPFWTFVPAGVMTALVFLIPGPNGDSAYAWMLADMLSPNGERLAQGVAYVRDFFITGATPLLVAIPILALVAGRLSRMGLRTLLLSASWTVFVILQGGGSLAFSQAMVPALPLFFLSVQQGMLALADLERRWISRSAWTLLAASILLSGLASKFPGNLGPLKALEWHETWMTATTEPVFPQLEMLGRVGLQDEIGISGALRNVATFFRQNVEPGRTILTPWPGALGYLSNMQVFDLFSRTNAAPGSPAATVWPPKRRADMLAALALKPDFILPGLVTNKTHSEQDPGEADKTRHILQRLMLLDSNPTKARIVAIEKALDEYELVTLPVALAEGQSRATRPFYVLRRRALALAPRLDVTAADGRLQIDLQHDGSAWTRSHPQLARLQVRATDSQEVEWALLPTGELSEDLQKCVRMGLLLHASGDRPTRLVDIPLPRTPAGDRVVELQAVLLNPWLKGQHAFTRVSEVVRIIVDE